MIHDASPREALRRAPMPPDLAAVDADWRREVAEACGEREPAPADDAGTDYFMPEQAMRLRVNYRLPVPQSFEAEAIAGLPQGALHEMSDADGKTYLAYRGFTRAHEPDSHHQLLGLSSPVDDDPRLDAASWALFGSQDPPRDGGPAQWERLCAEARAWRLLLQFDLAENLGEGAVYFVVRSADLATADFDGVVAAYQQT